MSSQSQHSRSEIRQSLVSHRAYQLWGSTLAKIAKTPRGLEKPRSQYSDLELCAFILQENKEGVQQLWETFTQDRKEVSRYLMDPKRESTVYLLGFHLANQARLSMALDRAEYRHRLLSQLSRLESIKLLDLGCGTGALSLQTAQELWSYREAMTIDWELVDKSQTFLEAAATGIEILKSDARPVMRRQTLDDYLTRELKSKPSEGAVWYQLGYVWNEISHNPRTRKALMNFLNQGLEAGQRVITILEPASQDIARNAMELRDELVEMGYVALYPCPHSSNCPMLERARDWCYSEAVWDRPPMVKKVDKILKIDRQRIGVGAYVFVSPDLLLDGKVAPGKTSPVVVGRPVEKAARLPVHQQISYLLCTPEAELDKTKAKKSRLELLRGQYYRDLPEPEKKPIIDRAPETQDEPAPAKKKTFGDRTPGEGEKPARKKKPFIDKKSEGQDKPAKKKTAVKKEGFGLAKPQKKISIGKKTALDGSPMKSRRN